MSWQFDLCGDHLALDFANTVSERETDAPVERLTDYGELVAFAGQTGIVTPVRARDLLDAARGDPRAAERALRQARALRDGLYALFAAVARGEPPGQDELAVLNAELWRLCLGSNLSLTWIERDDALDGFLGAIVLASVQLASTEGERARVRLCEAPDCVWLFYDTSRNRSRRWCDMRQCGNRMKARRHYARARGD